MAAQHQTRYEQAKAELQRTLVVSDTPKPRREPTRYAAFTVLQPWGWLIANASRWPDTVLGKTIENRSQPTSYRGPVLIHVSRRWENVGEEHERA